MLTYTAAKNTYARRQPGQRGKSLDSRTKLVQNLDYTYSIEYTPDDYTTPIKVATIRSDGKYVINAPAHELVRQAVKDRIQDHTSMKRNHMRDPGGKALTYFTGAVADSNGVVSISSIEKHGTGKAGPHAKEGRAIKWLKDTYNVTDVHPEAARWLYAHRTQVKRYRHLVGEGMQVMLAKSVNKGYGTRHGSVYSVGSRVEAKDYQANARCGAGLHFCANFTKSDSYNGTGSKHMRCWVDIKSIRVVGWEWVEYRDKVKARFCHVDSEKTASGNTLD